MIRNLYDSNVLYTSALFMSVLIIMIPVCSSSAIAGINEVKTYGSDGIEGFMPPDDELTVEARVSISGDDSIASSQVKLGNAFFSSCGNPDPNSVFTCLITIPTAGFDLHDSQDVYS